MGAAVAPVVQSEQGRVITNAISDAATSALQPPQAAPPAPGQQGAQQMGDEPDAAAPREADQPRR